MFELEQVDQLFGARLAKTEEGAHVLGELLAAARHGLSFIERAPSSVDEELRRWVVRSGERLYLKRYWESEQLFLSHFRRLVAERPRLPLSLEGLEEGRLLPQQREALEAIGERSLTLLTGGPGTGKSYTAVCLIEQARRSHRRIVVAAPTGKAASNLRIKLEERVYTVHALVADPLLLSAELLLVDEASMVEGELFAKLFARLPSGARCVLMGDRNQLPPVGVGHFFKDLLALYPEGTVELLHSKRTDSAPLLQLATAIQEERPIEMEPLPKAQEISHEIAERFVPFKERPFEGLKAFRVLTPLKRGGYGTEALNQLTHREFIKRGLPIPLLMTRNCKELELSNGDLGFLIGGEVILEDGRSLPEELLPAHDLGYTLTIHKSQGSEYDEVWVLLPEGSSTFGKELLYTAVTRAKKRVRILGGGSGGAARFPT